MDLIRLPPFPSVAASSISTLVTNLLRGYSLHGLVFERGGGAFTNAHLSNLRVRLAGKDIVNGLTGAQLVDLNEYDGLVDVTNYTTLFFGDPSARTIRGQHLGDVDLSLYGDDLEIEVTVGAATTPTLVVYALASVPKQSMGVGFGPAEAATFRALVRTVVQPAAAVTRAGYAINLGSRAGALLRRIAFFHTNMTSVEFSKNGLRKWDNVSIALNSAVAQQFARTPQSGLYLLDRIVDGNLGEAEPTVQSNGVPWNFDVALTTSAADTITAFADLLTNHPAL